MTSEPVKQVLFFYRCRWCGGVTSRSKHHKTCYHSCYDSHQAIAENRRGIAELIGFRDRKENEKADNE